MSGRSNKLHCSACVQLDNQGALPGPISETITLGKPDILELRIEVYFVFAGLVSQ